MENKFNEKLACLNKQQDVVYKKSVEEITNIREVAEQLKEQTKTVGKDNDKLCEEVKALVEQNNKATYANALKNNMNKNAMYNLGMQHPKQE